MYISVLYQCGYQRDAKPLDNNSTYFLWWMKKVLYDIMAILMDVSAPINFFTLTPDINIADDIKMLPPLTLPTMGWLFQRLTWPQVRNLQIWMTSAIIPEQGLLNFFLDGPAQHGHLAKSCRRFDLNTRYLVSSSTPCFSSMSSSDLQRQMYTNANQYRLGYSF